VILLSPAMTTGYDFRYTDCEWQIISKLAFADSRGRIAQSRSGKLFPKGSPEAKEGRLYSLYETALTLVQACGRAMRAVDDRCETFIIDDHMRWLYWKHKSLFPASFRRLYSEREKVPAPPLGLTFERMKTVVPAPGAGPDSKPTTD
jgi:Rad3-related DNA helicase